jgi:2-polyprenyl-3-methyl-5-hydroxy-6-metoxy-1,4-benzoquinol methylase
MNTSKNELDRIAHHYDSTVDFDNHFIRFNYREMRPHLHGPAILELGCASGVMTRWLARDFPTVHVVDGSQLYIDEVSKTVGEHVQFHHALFEEFRCPRRFNDIIMARALEHLDDPVGLLHTIREWIEPNGRLHLVVPNAQSLHRRLGTYMGLLNSPNDLSERDHKYGHRRVYDIDLLRNHITRAGWLVERVTGVFLKPLSNAQMTAFSPELIEALFAVGRELPLYGAELYAVARLPAALPPL